MLIESSSSSSSHRRLLSYTDNLSSYTTNAHLTRTQDYSQNLGQNRISMERLAHSRPTRCQYLRLTRIRRKRSLSRKRTDAESTHSFKQDNCLNLLWQLHHRRSHHAPRPLPPGGLAWMGHHCPRHGAPLHPRCAHLDRRLDLHLHPLHLQRAGKRRPSHRLGRRHTHYRERHCLLPLARAGHRRGYLRCSLPKSDAASPATLLRTPSRGIEECSKPRLGG